MHEYKVIPAPERAEKVKGLKRPEDRFAHKVESVLNDMAAAGWSFLRAESLPGEERRLLRTHATTHNMLVFYREVAPDMQATGAEMAPDTAPATTPPLSGAVRHDPGPGPRVESPGAARDHDEEQRG
mgnify:CR=1 FL=1